MQMKIFLLSFFYSLFLFSESRQPISPVSFVDLKRYTGLWHEIARLPNSTETNCVHATAEYTLNSNGFLGILQRCTKANGYTREAKGVARIDNAPENSRFSTNFVPHWLSWIGLGWEEQWIIDLDPNYQVAVISDPNRDYLWIFSRTGSIDKTTYDIIISKLHAQHFKLSHLIVSGEIIPEPQNFNKVTLHQKKPLLPHTEMLRGR